MTVIAAQDSPPGWVYAIQCDDWGPVKIGFSLNPEERLGTLQIGCPYQLHLRGMFKGGHATEAMLHKQLRGVRVRGEWFSPSLDVLSLVEEMKTSMLSDFNRGREPDMVDRFRKRAQSHLLPRVPLNECRRNA